MFIDLNPGLYPAVFWCILPKGAPRRHWHCLGPFDTGEGLGMTTWKRWSWRYRLIVLVALAPLLQGCFVADSAFTTTAPSVNVPGVGEVFLSQDPSTGEYVLKVPDPNTHRYVRVGPGDPRYPIIDAFFHRPVAPNPHERAGVPGGAGALPAPPVH
jgi:hypothetical protein